MESLINKNILLGVTGGIAAYKSAEIVRGLKKAGSSVRVVMTRSAQEFITPLTLQALSGNPISTDLLDAEAEAAMGHIELARWADAILIAPATANTIARLSSGRADDLLSSITLAFDGPVGLAPAMNQAMWKDKRTQSNIKNLENKDFSLYGPGSGEQACGDVGLGRMLEPSEIVELFASLFEAGSLSNKSVLITAGPTQEPIDPVRYVTNRSSGKMGYALAEAAVEAGAQVTLVSGPVNIKPPASCNLVPVETAQEMYDAVMHHVRGKDVYIGTAAVADYSPSKVESSKIKKKGNSEALVLKMKENQDILKTVSDMKDRPYMVGFAAETEDLLKNARKKLEKKKIDLIIANDVSNKSIGFDSEENEVTLITNSEEVLLDRSSKKKIAKRIVEFISGN
ncbi:bifunctional phosphopantothenoylcysteine decarboxylase/phosphopantothenate--cysteine ligase CoaBC [Gammaproteobacteria bacterium]|nr:bifunctional phosphopantothenoylcysteine decarboxylase/phosphopantothenate--cysteine ligase CoaBC [Gammaproteobacteria bacterium]|tara:strand:+ start:1817 stop:3010 length:1194 start_codon:yes stop_codon:yes gene_type:complete